MERICIIMATYNGETYLAEQITSILKNEYPNYVLHIFDDGSTDQTVAIATEFATKYPEKICVHSNEQNKGVIRNFLEASASIDADYYMYSDQDDVWKTDKIEKTLSFMKTHEKDNTQTPMVVFSDATVVNQNLETIAKSFQHQSGYRTDRISLSYLLIENKLIGCTIMFNHALREKLHCIDQFPSDICMHDRWISLIGAAFGSIAYLNEPLLLYRQHESNVIGNISKGNYIKNRITHLKDQKESIYKLCRQASAFLSIYEKELSPKNRKIIEAFATIPSKNWFCRRFYILHYHFLKSGWVRNLGVLLVI